MDQDDNLQVNPTNGIDDVWIFMGLAVELTLGDGGSGSEDKRYIYN